PCWRLAPDRRPPAARAARSRVPGPKPATPGTPAPGEERSRRFSFVGAPGLGGVAPALAPWLILIGSRSRSGLGLLLERLAGHRHEKCGLELLVDQLAVLLDDQVDALGEPVAQRNDHPATLLELVQQRLGNPMRSAGDDDRVEGSRVRPALVAVADPGVNIGIAKLLVHGRCSVRERGVDLDRIHILDQA